jgi:hypothetical protein
MTTTKRLAAIAAAIYLLGSVVAFGHAVNNCTMPKMYNGSDHPEAFVIKCLASAAGWPWYLSTVAFKPAQPVSVEKPL